MWLQCCMSAAQVESDVAHDLAWVGARTQSRVFEKAQMLQLGMRIDGPPVRLQSVRLAVVKRSQHRKSIMSVMQCKMCTPLLSEVISAMKPIKLSYRKKIEARSVAGCACQQGSQHETPSDVYVRGGRVSMAPHPFSMSGIHHECHAMECKIFLCFHLSATASVKTCHPRLPCN